MSAGRSGPASQEQMKRFSAWEFATRFRHFVGTQTRVVNPNADMTNSDDNEYAQADEEVCSEEEFATIIEDMRGYLADNQSQSEDDQMEYGMRLNRAVVGYPKERQAFFTIIQDRLANRRLHHLRSPDGAFATLAEAVFAEVIGLNVLESILNNKDDLEELQVVGTRIFEVRHAQAIRSKYSFRTHAEVERLQQNLVLFNRDSIHARKQWAEVSLQDGSRVTMTGFGFTSEPTITIRFFPVHTASLDSIAGSPYETIDQPTVLMLRAIIASQLNVVIIGTTNSGKTHLLKALLAEIPDECRIVTIENRYELMLSQTFPNKNIVEFEVSDEDQHRGGEQAFRLSLRQSPERIILAEIRDQEANLYVRACTRGHAGSMTTMHANHLEDIPDTITDMCMLDRRGMNPERMRRRIAKYVSQIGIEMKVVHGRRKVVRIGELDEMDGEIVVRDLVRYHDETGEWEHKLPITGNLQRLFNLHAPQILHELRELGQVVS